MPPARRAPRAPPPSTRGARRSKRCGHPWRRARRRESPDLPWWRAGRSAKRRHASGYDSDVKQYYARDALLPTGWARDVRITVERGDITAVDVASSVDGTERLHGPVLPGMANVHSHAFQRAMAGLTDVRAAPHDDFWSWRELMYQFMERLTPEQAQAIAAQLYIELLRHGYTAVAEFHYVHHPAEMLDRHLDAAHDAGIAITLLPSLYRWSGFGAKPLEQRQRRFASDVRSVLDMVHRLQRERTRDINA